MQLILLFILTTIFSGVTVWGTQLFRISPRTMKRNLFLLAAGILNGFLFSIIADFILKAGKPDFYFHTHKPGSATLRVFGISSFFSAAFYSPFLMIIERRKAKKTVIRWLILSAIIAGCSAVILEIGYSNFRHFELI